MHAVPDTFEHPLDAAEFKRPRTAPAWSCTAPHRATPSSHTTRAYGLGAIEGRRGALPLPWRGAPGAGRHAGADEPDELHTGRAETAAGWRYRMAHLDAPLLEELSGERGWWFAEAVGRDAASARRTTRLLRQLWHASEPLAFDALLQDLVDELRPSRAVPRPRATALLPLRAGDRADARAAGRAHHAGGAGRRGGLSPFHFQRQFKRAHHATPQQMLMALLHACSRPNGAARHPATRAGRRGRSRGPGRLERT